MLVRIDIAQVVGPSVIVEKARCVLESSTDEGRFSLSVQDRRTGGVIEQLLGAYEGDPSREMRFTADGGDVWTITKQRGCGCGGTRITHVERTTTNS